jgi:drug/metabolite transporter (DMT)-like permease
MTKTVAAVVTLIAIGGISTAALFIKLCGMDSLAIAFWRMALGGAVFAALLAFCPRSIGALFALGGRGWVMLLAASALLALHFGAWIAAFDYTSVSSNLILLVTQPAFAALLGLVYFGERITKFTVIALVLAAAGSAAILHADATAGASEGGKSPLFGDMLCIISALALAVFYSLAKSIRRTVDFVPFNASVFLISSSFLLAATLLTGSRLFGYVENQWLYMGLIVLVPTCLGHALLNFTARYTRIFTVNFAVVGETALGIGLALLFLPDEIISALRIAGAAVLAAGVFVVFLDEKSDKKSSTTEDITETTEK